METLTKSAVGLNNPSSIARNGWCISDLNNSSIKTCVRYEGLTVTLSISLYSIRTVHCKAELLSHPGQNRRVCLDLAYALNSQFCCSIYSTYNLPIQVFCSGSKFIYNRAETATVLRPNMNTARKMLTTWREWETMASDIIAAVRLTFKTVFLIGGNG